VDLVGQALEAADVGVVAEDDLGRLHQFLEQGGDQGAALFHREGLDLQDEGVAELVDHDAGKAVGFGPDQAADVLGEALWKNAGTAGEGGLEGGAQVGLIQLDAVPAQAAENDLRAAVVEAGADEAPGTIAAFHHFAIKLGRDQGFDLVGKDPGMPLEDAGLGVGLEFEGGNRHASTQGWGCAHLK